MHIYGNNKSRQEVPLLPSSHSQLIKVDSRYNIHDQSFDSKSQRSSEGNLQQSAMKRSMSNLATPILMSKRDN